MRKIIVIADITLDGIVQAPGEPDEDMSGGFKYGGWVAPYLDEASFKAIKKLMDPADYLLGRKTFEMFANYWPKHADFWPGINDGTKYVMSETLDEANWKNTVFLRSIEDVEKIKKTDGADIQVWGSSNLVQSLLKNNLVDEIWLKVYPVTIGSGKKLFGEGTMPAAYTLTDSEVTSTGVMIVKYERTGEVKTGVVEV